MQVWRAHRAQFFKWKQEQDSGGSSRETASAAVSSSAMRALTLQLEVRLIFCLRPHARFTGCRNLNKAGL